MIHPFPYLDVMTRKERTSPAEGWSVDPMRADNLGRGEGNLRDYTVKYLRQFSPENSIFYDPACLTGEFLAELKRHFPNCITIRQDLSQQMVDVAKLRVDQVVQGNAINPYPSKQSVDYMFVRFLNAEVVTSEQAHTIFDRLVEVMKNSGRIIIFGHTPVLIQSSYFKKKGFIVDQMLGYLKTEPYIFRYYVLRKSTS